MAGGIQFQPVCEDDTEDVQGELDGNELSTGGMVRDFCSPYGDDGVQDTRTDTVNKTRYNISASPPYSFNFKGLQQIIHS
jgi:hypothetical protein